MHTALQGLAVRRDDCTSRGTVHGVTHGAASGPHGCARLGVAASGTTKHVQHLWGHFLQAAGRWLALCISRLIHLSSLRCRMRTLAAVWAIVLGVRRAVPVITLLNGELLSTGRSGRITQQHFTHDHTTQHKT